MDKSELFLEPMVPLRVSEDGRWGGLMPSSTYFLRQADICLRLSLVASDEQVSNRLIAMAQEYKAKAAALESGTASLAPEIDRPDEAADSDVSRN